jgi:GNAT superfamily N-acetyltransferase
LLANPRYGLSITAVSSIVASVEPGGLGVGSRLVAERLRFATRGGYKQLTLWTNDVLASGRKIYQAAGFTLPDEEAHHSFGRDLVGQHWNLAL